MRRAEPEMNKPKKPTKPRDDEDEGGSRKSKKKKPAKTNTLLFVLIGGGVAVLLLGCILAGVLGYVFWPKKDDGGKGNALAPGPVSPVPKTDQIKSPPPSTKKENEKPAAKTLEKTYFIIDTRSVLSGIAKVRIEGLPADQRYGSPYELVEIASVTATPPPKGSYYVLRSICERKDLSSTGGVSSFGPLFLKQLPAGTTLTDVKAVGTFQAKVKGFHGPGITDVLPRASPWTLHEAVVQAP
jgi:hypothetical protein